jgi:hypothetical protein
LSAFGDWATPKVTRRNTFFGLIWIAAIPSPLFFAPDTLAQRASEGHFRVDASSYGVDAQQENGE